MAAIQYARLYPDALQLQAKNGTNLTAGWVLVFLAGTDDPATTYADFNGTVNPQKIVIDDNGRFCAIVDKAKAYRVEVYDSEGMLQWTTEPVWCTGNAGSGMSVTRVVSTNGSISVEENIAGTERTYDVGIAPADSDEFLEWVKCVDESVANGNIFPTYVEGTMETMVGQGLHVGKDKFYHGSVTITVVPTGIGINYETLSASLKFGEDTVVRRNFDIDNSLHDSVVCEFSYDFKAPEDGYLYLNIENVGVFSQVDVEMQVHRIYSGINAVPDTCATQQWVRGYFDFNLSGKVDYSAIEYNQDNEITGISGSAIAAGSIDSAFVSSVASSYAESAVSGISAWSGYFSSISSKADSSALSSYQPVSAMSSYATESYVDSAVSGKLDVTASSQFLTSLPDDLAYTSDVASAVSGKMDKSESSSFYPMDSNPSGYLTAHQSLAGYASEQYVDSAVSSKLDASAYDSAWFQPASSMSAWIPYSALDYSGTAISGIGGSSLAGMGVEGHTYSGINPVVVDNVNDTISVEHRTLCVDSTMTAYNSGSSAVLGVNAAQFAPSGDYVYSSALGTGEI